MTLTPREQATFGFARARDRMFDAVRDLWRVRKAEGMTVEQVAEKIGRSPRWVRHHLSGPGQWTLRVFGELVEAMDGDVEVCVLPDKAPIVQILSDRLYHKTKLRSSSAYMTEQPEFEKLLELGDDTLSYISHSMRLGEIRIFWFPLLKRITQADPVPVEDRGQIFKMTQHWLAWLAEHKRS